MFKPSSNPSKPSKVCDLCGGKGHSAKVCANNFEDDEPSLSTLNINGLANAQRQRKEYLKSLQHDTNHNANMQDLRETKYGKPKTAQSGYNIKENNHSVRGPMNSSENKEREPNNRKNPEYRCKQEMNNQEHDQPRRAAYIPPVPVDDDINYGNTIGENFYKYDTVKTNMSGNSLPIKMMSFEEFPMVPTIQKNLTNMNITHPTPIQKCALPAISTGRDVMACATTGSGKTAAFLIPVLNSMLEKDLNKKQGHPTTLIVSPTKELTRQIHEDVRKISHSTPISSCLVYGGVSIGYQIGQVQQGCNIVVATPGRLIHFLNQGIIKLNQLEHFILDEADTMLKMDFMKDIERIVNEFDMPDKAHRQMLMFSATFPKEIQLLARKFLNSNYIYITIGLLGGACQDVKQYIYSMDPRNKKAKLDEILDEINEEKVLIFVSTRKFADFLASYLSQNGRCATTIHGDREQCQREEALLFFKTNKCNILIATDVMSRGHDISGLKHVVIFDMPIDMDSYVHRIGRTGRLGNIGSAYVFFSPQIDSEKSRSLVNILSQAQQEIPNWLGRLADNTISHRIPNNQENRNPSIDFISQALNDDSDDNWD